jgi:cyclophilin family peptidyl-prolyl cis-trans isomerase
MRTLAKLSSTAGLTALTILGLSLLSSCSTMRKVEGMIPEIPEIVLIGKKDKPEDTPLIPDLKKDVAVFKLDVMGQTRRVAIQLYPADAPLTVANFQENIRRNYYDGMAIHRVIPNYLVQMGDPQSKDPRTRAGWGTGGLETTLPSEIKLRHRLGTVGMARLSDASNPTRKSSGSQFYITTGDMRKFDGKYTVFGQVIQGYDTLQTISELPADENDNPYQRVQIKSTHLDRSSNIRPEDINALQRKTRRRTVEEMPTRQDGLVKRTWRQLW